MIQFGRFASVTVSDAKTGAGTVVSGVRIVFKVLKDLTRVNNTADIEVYNLSDTTRNLFSGVGASILLQAGYVGIDGKENGVGTVFYGDVIQQSTSQEGPEKILRISAADSYQKFRSSNHEFTFAAGYSAIKALQNVLQAAGVPLDFPGSLSGFVPDRPFLTGWQFSGSTRKALEKLAARLGLEFFMIDGRARFLIQGASTALVAHSMTQAAALARAQTIAPYISPESGLIGSIIKHSMLKDTGKTSKDAVKVEERHGWRFRCLLNPFLQPGGPVYLKGASIPAGGAFRLDRIVQNGDTHGPTWESECIVPDDALKVDGLPAFVGGA